MGFLFNVRKPRPYNVKYRVYDEQKERLRESEARVRAKMDNEGGDEEEVRTSRLQRGVFRDSVESSRAEKNRNMRLGIIIGALLIIAYAFIHYAG